MTAAELDRIAALAEKAKQRPSWAWPAGLPPECVLALVAALRAAIAMRERIDLQDLSDDDIAACFAFDRAIAAIAGDAGG